MKPLNLILILNIVHAVIPRIESKNKTGEQPTKNIQYVRLMLDGKCVEHTRINIPILVNYGYPKLSLYFW